MPKALQKRGRRMKRKHEDDPDGQVAEASSKRRKSHDESDEQQPDEPFMSLPFENEDMSAAYPQAEKAFFGMLDEEEQEFFKNQDRLLDDNQFSDSAERTKFLNATWKQAGGKELKLACSQSCSRLLERLMRTANPSQLKQVFQAFSGKCVETLHQL